MPLRSYQRDRDAAERALDRWGAWRGFSGSLELRDAVVCAIEAERERIAKFLDRLSYYDQAYTVRNQDSDPVAVAPLPDLEGAAEGGG